MPRFKEKDRKQRRHNADGEPVEGAPHGTITGYNKYKCRCKECRSYYNHYNKMRRHGYSPRKMVQVSEKIRPMMIENMEFGWSQAMLCRILKMDKCTLAAIVNGKQLTVKPDTAARIIPILSNLGFPKKYLERSTVGVKRGSSRSVNKAKRLFASDPSYIDVGPD